MKNKLPYPVYLIEWLDHHSTEGWVEPHGIKDIMKLVTVVSIGFLLAENKQCVVLAMDVSDDYRGGCMTIGKKDIVKRIRLK